MTTISVLGAGAFGTALAVALAGNGPVTLWGRDTGWGRDNPRLPGVRLPDAVTVTDDLDAAQADIMLLALPAQALGAFLRAEGTRLDAADRALVSTAKGIDLTTLHGPSRMIADACPSATVAVLTGPSFAADIARGLPTALTLATAEPDRGAALQHALSTPVLRLYRTTDVIGAELGGALKNIVAIAAGAAIGAGLGDSARAAIITRGFAEMTRMAAFLGAQPETLTGLSGFGDLVLTCTSEGSRNFRFGQALGAGQPFDPAITVEGAATARAVAAIAASRSIDMPLSTTLARVIDGALPIREGIAQLLTRPLKEE